jgi:5-formyltetrahydrofolate cyclo-ligase
LAKGRPAPRLVGLALDEQIVDLCPMEEHDRVLDVVVTPSALYFKP